MALERIAFLLILCYSVVAGDDLYRILGVSRSASVKEIKSAYRKKARETHPDKNVGVDPEAAAEAFRQVVHAFEILSDEQSRQTYDRTGRASSATDPGNHRQQQQQQYRSWTWSFQRRPVRLKDKFEVQEAMSRVLHVVSLTQLHTVMLDEHDLLERDLLMVFCTAGDVEQHVDDEMVFPYPFAGMSSQHIWWEDLLQTVKIRFHRGNDLTREFGIDSDTMRTTATPVFLFGKKGTSLEALTMARLSTRNRHDFEMWVWKQMEVEVDFVNNHSHACELYWIHGSRAHHKADIPAGHRIVLTTMLTHEWYARDARVDTRADSPGRYKLSAESSLGSWKIGPEDGPARLESGSYRVEIGPVECFDMSGHCTFWQSQGECRKNPRFMEEACRLTCKICEPDEKKNKSTTGDEL